MGDKCGNINLVEGFLQELHVAILNSEIQLVFGLNGKGTSGKFCCNG